MARGRKPKGLGDVIENITQATGIDKVVHAIVGDDCGCKERKEKLNKLFPFGKRVRECLTQEQIDYLKEFFDAKETTLHPKRQRELSDIYLHLYGIRIDTSCASCWRGYINELKQVYEEVININAIN